MLSFCAIAIGAIASSAAMPDPLKIEFFPTATQGCAVAAPDQSFVVSVYVSPTSLSRTDCTSGDSRQELELLGKDGVTKLCFFKNPKAGAGNPTEWAIEFKNENPGPLRAVAPSRMIECGFERWVTQVGDKVLPLGLLSISFTNGIPPAGTPLIDSKGKIIGLILQPATSNTAYAIPAQAVRRVQQDIARHGKLVKGWVGLSLSTGSQIPRITRVLPDSPAATAGMRKNDILLRAGQYSTARYPDAVNALFYTAPGQPTTFQWLRAGETIAAEVTPIAK